LALNEADTLKSSSILIYSCQAQSFYTQGGLHDAVVIKKAELIEGRKIT
jgi:hypothetical protein